MTGLTIGEMARRAGVRPSALRYYERAGLLPAPQRINGRRRYDPGVLQRLAAIRLAQHAGFTLAQIRLLLDGVDRETAPSARWRALAPGKIAELEALMARLRDQQRLLEEGLRCTCRTLGECDLVRCAG